MAVSIHETNKAIANKTLIYRNVSVTVSARRILLPPQDRPKGEKTEVREKRKNKTSHCSIREITVRAIDITRTCQPHLRKFETPPRLTKSAGSAD
ncbi:hypothetical protein GWI33_021603 [Rhynchophorus ferrugineus]|uniref:Uncharacterized protein n=1 Tax=Rhynchophorus ferrugineus TaxID=354439 RepID=A0A834ITH9_RHYFE|nr:hypothetical protein GWI33_021603 [Rhynchophorus ferrugineus]